MNYQMIVSGALFVWIVDHSMSLAMTIICVVGKVMSSAINMRALATG